MVLQTAHKLTLNVNKPNFTNLLLTKKNIILNRAHDNKPSEKVRTTFIGLQSDNSLKRKICTQCIISPELGSA
jgi:hypothetical protein